MSEADRGAADTAARMSETMPTRADENQYRFADDLKAAGQIMANAKRQDGQSRSQ